MSYATVAQLKSYLSKPADGTDYGVTLTDDLGNTPAADRYPDAIIQTLLDAASALTDGELLRLTSIPANSAVAIELDLLHTSAVIVSSFEREIAEGSTRGERLWERYRETMADAMSNPAVMGGTLVGISYFVDGVAVT